MYLVLKIHILIEICCYGENNVIKIDNFSRFSISKQNIIEVISHSLVLNYRDFIYSWQFFFC